MGKIVEFEITFDCPVCGESVRAGSKSCPECGACKKSGWSEDVAYDGLNLPDDEFDYDNFAAKEFGKGGSPKTGAQRWWPIVALILVIAMLLPLLRSCAP